jgi:hypothetical protein
MRKIPAVVFSSLLALCSVNAQEITDFVGYVTRATSPSDFDINGLHILCYEGTIEKDPSKPNQQHKGCPSGPLFLGEGMRINGALFKKERRIEAWEIDISQIAGEEVKGSAVIDAPPDKSNLTAGNLAVRADGYKIHLDAKTAIVWESPQRSLAEVAAGHWINYKGKRNPDGSLTATHVVFKSGLISKSTQLLRQSTDFDPSAVPASSKQNVVSASLIGPDPKKFPPHSDPIMQARVTSIGEKLIPRYQVELPDSDPTKIHFRFQVVENNIWWDAVALPSGIILVSPQVVERMQNDSQLAAILADNIASILEEQPYKNFTLARNLNFMESASQGAMIANPAIGLAGLGALGLSHAAKADAATILHSMMQSGRVALGLLNDAGYETNQAPIAWWLLGKEKETSTTEIPIPLRATYSYKILGENWNNPAVKEEAPSQE